MDVLIYNQDNVLVDKAGKLPNLKSISELSKIGEFLFVKKVKFPQKKIFWLVFHSVSMVPNLSPGFNGFQWKSKDIVDISQFGDFNKIEKIIKSPKIIIITGTPAIGKTTFAVKLSLLIRANYIDITEFVKNEGLGAKDNHLDTLLVNKRVLTTKLTKYVKKLQKGGYSVVIDGHMAHYLSPKIVDLAIVLTINDLKLLNRRLLKRGYNSQKVKDNLDSEIFKVCLVETQEMGHNFIELYATDNKAKNKLLKLIRFYLK